MNPNIVLQKYENEGQTVDERGPSFAEYMGSLIWPATISRPDIACSLAFDASSFNMRRKLSTRGAGVGGVSRASNFKVIITRKKVQNLGPNLGLVQLWW
jgi:hypothetical protein